MYACASIHSCAGDELRRERSCSRIPLDGACYLVAPADTDS